MKNNLGNVKTCKTMIKQGLIIVNDAVITEVKYPVSGDDRITYQGKVLKAQPFHYYMLNKPAGYICANHDKKYSCVVDLVDQNCFCLGRLDKDTTGLLIVTDDASLSKKLLLPQNHVSKRYLVTTRYPLQKELINSFQAGVIIDRDTLCKPARLEIIDNYHCFVTIQEGKYHQIKKMFLSNQNEVIGLKRISFGKLILDEQLKEGEYRLLQQNEINCLIK